MSLTQDQTETDIRTVEFHEGILIRAAAFSRLITKLSGFIENIDSILQININENYDEDEDKILNENLKWMVTMHGSAPSGFPVKNMDTLAKMVLKLVRFYEHYPNVSGKMNACLMVQLFGMSVLGKNRLLLEKNKRDVEVNNLNNQLFKLSDSIKGKNVSVIAEPIIKKDHEFHPDSEFILFKIV